MATRRRVRKTNEKNSIEEQIDTFIQENKFYEALQIFHTLFGRLRARDQKEEAEQKIIEASRLFVSHGANDCVIELCKLILKSLEDDERPIDGETGGKAIVLGMIDGLPASHERLVILNTLNTWAEKTLRKLNSPLRFDSDIVVQIAKCHEELGDLVAAAQNYCKTNDMEGYTTILLNLSEHGPYEEKDLYFARAILLLLAEGRVTHAKQLVNILEQKLSPNAPELKTPIMNFTNLTTILADNRSGKNEGQAFIQLMFFYQEALSRDKFFEQFCSRIKTTVFHQPSPTQGMNNMMEMVMKMLSGGN